jgi:hypothetical protein
MNTCLTPHFHKRLQFFLVVVVSSGIQLFFVETIFSDGLACRLPVFLRNGNKPELKHRLHRGRRY